MRCRHSKKCREEREASGRCDAVHPLPAFGQALLLPRIFFPSRGQKWKCPVHDSVNYFEHDYLHHFLRKGADDTAARSSCFLPDIRVPDGNAEMGYHRGSGRSCSATLRCQHMLVGAMEGDCALGFLARARIDVLPPQNDDAPFAGRERHAQVELRHAAATTRRWFGRRCENVCNAHPIRSENFWRQVSDSGGNSRAAAKSSSQNRRGNNFPVCLIVEHNRAVASRSFHRYPPRRLRRTDEADRLRKDASHAVRNSSHLPSFAQSSLA